MSKSFIYVVAACLVVGLGALTFVYFKMPQNAPVETSNTDTPVGIQVTPTPPSGVNSTKPPLAQTRVKEGTKYVTIVTVSDAGFSPSNFMVYPGETVRFVNKDQQSMRIIGDTADGLLPYPGFDQTKSVGKGGTYQFIFSQLGAWGFINQYNPTHPSLIVVVNQ